MERSRQGGQEAEGMGQEGQEAEGMGREGQDAQPGIGTLGACCNCKPGQAFSQCSLRVAGDPGRRVALAFAPKVRGRGAG